MKNTLVMPLFRCHLLPPFMVLLCLFVKPTMVGAQTLARDTMQTLFYQLLENDGVLISAKQRQQDSLTKKPKQYKKEHQLDQQLRDELGRLQLFNDAAFSIDKDRTARIKNEALTSIASRAVKDRDLATINSAYRLDFLRPQNTGFFMPAADQGYHALDFRSASLGQYQGSFSAETNQFLQAKLAGKLGSETEANSNIHMLAGRFDTWQGMFVEDLRRNMEFDLHDYDFFMSLWTNPAKRNEDDYLIRRISGIVVQTGMQQKMQRHGDISSDIRAAFQFPFVAAKTEMSTQKKFTSDYALGKQQFSLLLTPDDIDFEPCPTNNELKTAMLNSMEKTIALAKKETEPDEYGKVTIAVDFNYLTKDMADDIDVDRKPFMDIISNHKILSPPDVSWKRKNDSMSTAVITINYDYVRGVDAGSEISRQGFVAVPIRFYYKKVRDNDTLYVYRNETGVRINLNNYPVVANDDNILTISKKDSAGPFHFTGIIPFKLSGDQSLEFIRGKQFFTQLEKVDSINATSYFTPQELVELQSAFQTAAIDRDNSNAYNVDLILPSKFFPRMLNKRLTFKCVIPVKQARETLEPRRNISVILIAPSR